MDKTFRFPCDRWLAKNKDDGQLMRELACANNDCLDLNEKTSKTSTHSTTNRPTLAVFHFILDCDLISCYRVFSCALIPTNILKVST